MLRHLRVFLEEEEEEMGEGQQTVARTMQGKVVTLFYQSFLPFPRYGML
jgi:hypothetical protein